MALDHRTKQLIRENGKADAVVSALNALFRHCNLESTGALVKKGKKVEIITGGKEFHKRHEELGKSLQVLQNLNCFDLHNTPPTNL